MCEVNPEFLKEIQQEVKKNTLYLRVLKALYGCIKSALLWYNLFKGTLENERFDLNPYYKCTENKMINEKHCTIQWYVYDNKVTHISKDEITGVIDTTKKVFEELVVSLRKKDNFIGMDIELVKDGKVNIGMHIYTKEAIETFGEYVSRGVTSPATSRLFNVTEGAEKVFEEKPQPFTQQWKKYCGY